MKRKIAIAFAGLLLMFTASFAPIAQSQAYNVYVTMAGKVDGRMWIYVQTVAPYLRAGLAIPFAAPFVTRLPFLKPNHLLEGITFGAPVDVNNDTLMDIIPIQKEQINPIVHYIFIGPPLRPSPTFWRMTLFAPAPGGGVIFINPYMPGDVDCYTENYDDGVYWASPSPLAGQKAAESGGFFSYALMDFVPGMAARFPSGGLDTIPGTALWELAAYGMTTDGFGDGVPDPPGSSILMLPLILLGEEWNATTATWEPTLNVPMPLVMTTGVAFDHVASPGSFMYCTNSTEVGEPWHEDYHATYVCAWSNLLYALNPDDDGDGIPDPEAGTGYYFTVDLFYEYVEKKVRQDLVVADINCDNIVTISDIVIGALAFGTHDEGLGPDGIPLTADDWIRASPNYDPRADLDCNGVINILDLVHIAVDFGKSVP